MGLNVVFGIEIKENIKPQEKSEIYSAMACIDFIFGTILEKNKLDFKGLHIAEIVFMDKIFSDKVFVMEKHELKREGIAGYYKTEVQINCKNFKSLSNYEKKKETLKLLMNGIRRIVEYQGWDKTPFEDTNSKISETDYICEWKRNKPQQLAKHNSKKLKAGIGVIRDIGKLDEYFVFICDSRQKELYRETIFSDEFGRFGNFLNKHIRNTRYWPLEINWDNENKIIITNLVGHPPKWIVTVPNDIITKNL